MKIINLLLALVLLFAFINCTKQSSVRTSGTTSVSTDPVTDATDDTSTTTSNDDIDAAGVGDQPIEYYKINDPTIVLHGAAGGEVLWSSRTNLTSNYSQNMFVTDSRFNMRVVARPGPSKNEKDAKNVTCKNYPKNYAKLQVKVRVKKYGQTYGSVHTFDDIAVNTASDVYEFTVPANISSSYPIVVEILDVKWDYTCNVWYAGYEDSPSAAWACPWDYVWVNDCVQLELQFSTDATKDIPH